MAAPSTTIDTGEPRGRRHAWVLVVVGVLAALVGFAAVVALRPDEAGPQVAVALEAAGEPGDDAFTPSVSDAPVDQIQVMLASLQPEEPAADASTTGSAGGAVEVREGSSPGLYGGSGDTAVCDAAALAAYLAEEPEKAGAWAAALGITVDEIDGYVASLTPVVLTADTLVTNHGFSAGRATPRQSVLQAGTAVMVDRFGVPRVRCECGNPLADPVVTDAGTGVRFEGESWETFDETAVISVAAAPSQLDAISVTALDGSGAIDLGTGAPSVRAEDLLGATVTGLCGGPDEVTLVDGADPRFGDDPLEGFAGIRDSVMDLSDIGGEDIAVGDLDGRPGDEAAAIFLCSGGGKLVEFQIFVFRASPTGPVQVGEVPWDEDILSDAYGDYVSDLSIADGWLSYRAGALGPNDANCCPSTFISRRYRLDGNTFVAAPPPDMEITTRGLEPAQVGMDYDEVALVLGREIRLFTLDMENAQTASCAAIDVVEADLDGIGSAGVAMSFSVRDPAVSTPEGITVGSTLDDVLAAYPTARTEPNLYREWSDYYVDGLSEDGTPLALRFILDVEQRVEEIYGGDLEFVSLSEGCA